MKLLTEEEHAALFAELAEARATAALHAVALAAAQAREAALREALAEADGTQRHAVECVRRRQLPPLPDNIDRCPDCNADLAKQRRIIAALAPADTSALREFGLRVSARYGWKGPVAEANVDAALRGES